MAEQGAPPRDTTLRRTLNVWSAVGVSVALMAPSMAININPQGTASAVGRAVPLAFLLASVGGVLLIAHTFVRLSQRFSHAGSVYAFVGVTLEPRAGSVAGWLNAGTYVFYGAVTSTAAGIFFLTDLARKVAAPKELPDWVAFAFAWLVLAAVWWLSAREVKGGTTVLLVTEGLTITLILVVAAITLGKLITGHTPNGQRVDMSVFTVAPGTSVSTVFLGIVFGFLSFAGFEAAATLGEETDAPRRNIPRAILGTALFGGGVFFVAVTAIEVMAFGTDTDGGVAAFVRSDALMGDLAQQYVAPPWLSYVIVIGATFSAAACCLASVVGASRLIFALSRDGIGPPRHWAAIHPPGAMCRMWLPRPPCCGVRDPSRRLVCVAGAALRRVHHRGHSGNADLAGGIRTGHAWRHSVGVPCR